MSFDLNRGWGHILVVEGTDRFFAPDAFPICAAKGVLPLGG